MPAARVAPADRDRRLLRHSSRGGSTGSDCPSLQDATEEEEDAPDIEHLTPYQKVVQRLQTDDKWHKDITLGKRIGFYRIGEELGTGNFSQVKAAVHTLTKERVAVKILDKAKLDHKTQKMLVREIASMESMHHPNIIRLYEVLETLSKIYLVMEYASGGELFHRISNNGYFTEDGARLVFAQIIAAVDHMHRHNIVHRDLKAENVFFSAPDVVKVGDFGFSTQLQDQLDPLRTFCGSPPYAAPELFRDDSYAGPGVDVWALGVLLYFMLTATMPFKAQTVAALKKQILEGEFSIPDRLDGDCHFLIRGILRQDPRERITLQQVKLSNWLSAEVLAGSLPRDPEGAAPPCSPGSATPPTSAEDREAALGELRGLGISGSMLEECRFKGSRSSVTGTYRITLHRLQSCKEQKSLDEKASEKGLQLLRRVAVEKPVKILKNRKSKTCNIL